MLRGGSSSMLPVPLVNRKRPHKLSQNIVSGALPAKKHSQDMRSRVDRRLNPRGLKNNNNNKHGQNLLKTRAKRFIWQHICTKTKKSRDFSLTREISIFLEKSRDFSPNAAYLHKNKKSRDFSHEYSVFAQKRRKGYNL